MRFGKDVSELRNLNKSIVLKIIYIKGPISKSNLSELSSLSRVTITKIIDDLIKEELILLKSKGESTGGRQPYLYEFNYNNFSTIGIDIGESEIRGIVADLKGKIIYEKVSKFSKEMHKNRVNVVIEESAKLIEYLQKQSNIVLRKLIGVGISFPGTVDPETGEIYDSPNLGGIGLLLKKLFYKKIKCKVPLFIENDANAGAFGEYWFGAGKDKDFLLYIFAGEGTGCGLVIDGKIYRGLNHAAADIGHTIIDINGRKCRCGNYGCVETFTSYSSIVRRFEERVKQWGESSSMSIKEENNNNIEKVNEIINEAKKNDQLSLKIIEETGRILGFASLNLINLYDPNILILGGRLSTADKLIMDPLEKIIRERAKNIQKRKLIITRSKLEPNSCALGVVALAINDFLNMD